MRIYALLSKIEVFFGIRAMLGMVINPLRCSFNTHTSAQLRHSPRTSTLDWKSFVVL